MERLIATALERLERSGLVAPGNALLGAVDDTVYWNRRDPKISVLAPVFEQLDIAALLYARPAEPYRGMIDFLAAHSSNGVIRPEDTESRTFLHEIRVETCLSTDAVVRALASRKSVVLPDGYVAVSGTVSVEQAYLHFSSVCFAVLVAFLSMVLSNRRAGRLCSAELSIIEEALPLLPLPRLGQHALMTGPFEDELTAHAAMIEAGRAVVGHRLVDSFFGNISYRIGDVLFISQTGSALDALEGAIDPVQMHGGSSAAITASSELVAHLNIVETESVRAVLHGHPPFAVALSLDCDRRETCAQRASCHILCDAARAIGETPIIPGEVGTGPYGISTTLPPAIRGKKGVIVYGHGVFTVGRIDFKDAFETLVRIETACRERFLKRVGF